MSQEITEITVREDGSETHESWLVANANKVSASPGVHLFDSEIAHQHFVRVTVRRCSRKRDHKRDWIYAEKVILEMDMSFAQWGAFISSFGDGSGVPATLGFLIGEGRVPQAPYDPRLGESMREVREAADEALSEITDAYQALSEAFERGAGKREMRALMHDLGCRVSNGPANMEFAAKSLVDHTEKVVTKAKADVEAMVAAAQDTGARTLTAGEMPLLPAGSER